MIRKLLYIFLFLIYTQNLYSESVINFDFHSSKKIKPEVAEYQNSVSENPDFNLFKSINLPFIPAKSENHFIKFTLKSNSNIENIGLSVPFLNCEKIELSIYDSLGKLISKPNLSKSYPGMVYNIANTGSKSIILVFKIKSTYTLFFPIRISNYATMQESEKKDNFVYNMYFGILLIMSLYNLFVFYSTRDKSYLLYVIYIISFGLAQFALNGYFNSYFIFGDFILSKQLGIIFSGISGVFGVLFFNSFLETKTLLPKIRNILFVFVISYSIVILMGVFNQFFIAFNLLNINGGIVGIISLIGSIILYKRNNKNAKFFMIAWIIFIIALFSFVLINIGILPYNSLTKFILPTGSAVEVALLSLALANKINILQKENNKLIVEQNIELEKQVKIRTKELEDAQAQLINSEKMASLGQLTAGIAHEINNPINFITSNIQPLKRDIKDYEELLEFFEDVNPENLAAKMEILKSKKDDYDYLKTEVQMLLDGMEEGAKRTAEIVKNLKVFSHIDKAQLSPYSVNEGIISTLKLINHRLTNIRVETHLGDLPIINCFPGKLNQVFMNLMTNAIDAVSGVHNAVISITSYSKHSHIFIQISDNGIGMEPEILKDIFNPFFTTKDVGSGTGLGLSISMAIIKDHQGELTVESKSKKGSTFTIELPKEFQIIE